MGHEEREKVKKPSKEVFPKRTGRETTCEKWWERAQELFLKQILKKKIVETIEEKTREALTKKGESSPKGGTNDEGYFGGKTKPFGVVKIPRKRNGEKCRKQTGFKENNKRGGSGRERPSVKPDRRRKDPGTGPSVRGVFLGKEGRQIATLGR